MTARVTFTKSWDHVVARFNNARPWLEKPGLDGLRAAAETITEELQNRAESNPRPRLAEATIARKRRRGSATPAQRLNDTGWFLRHGVAKPRVRRNGNGTASVTIGMTKEKHPQSGLTATELFLMFEFGTSTQPARPVFRPLIRDVANGKIPAMRSFERSYIRNLKLL